jgi:hypothetical protein
VHSFGGVVGRKGLKVERHGIYRIDDGKFSVAMMSWGVGGRRMMMDTHMEVELLGVVARSSKNNLMIHVLEDESAKDGGDNF